MNCGCSLALKTKFLDQNLLIKKKYFLEKSSINYAQNRNIRARRRTLAYLREPSVRLFIIHSKT